jgi:hypothetical protein
MMVAIAKWGGDDKYSWAVFVEGQRDPVVSGLTRNEASYHAGIIAEQLKEQGDSSDS